jgi:hypothetical protein
MPAKVRHADVLKGMGFGGELEEFRRTPADVKAVLFPGFTDEELTYTRDEAGAYCAAVRKRLGASRLIGPRG